MCVFIDEEQQLLATAHVSLLGEPGAVYFIVHSLAVSFFASIGLWHLTALNDP